MKQFQYVRSRTGTTFGPYTEAEVQEMTVKVQYALHLAPGQTWTDHEGDVWSRADITVAHLPGETILYVPAGRLERIATAVTEGMVNTIRSEDDYHRIRALAADRGMSVSQWIACDAVKQAHALIAELDKQA